MNNILLSPIPLEELTDLFTSIIRKELRAKHYEEGQEKFLSAKETCKLFSPSISLVTLNSWAGKGILYKHYIGGRTYYKQSEVMQAVKSIKKYRKHPDVIEMQTAGTNQSGGNLYSLSVCKKAA